MIWLLIGFGIIFTLGVFAFMQTRQTADDPPRTQEDIYREDAVELPRVRFNDEGEPTDSFVRQLKDFEPKEDAE